MTNAFPVLKSTPASSAVDSPIGEVWLEGGLTERKLYAALALMGIFAGDKTAAVPVAVNKAAQAARSLELEMEKV